MTAKKTSTKPRAATARRTRAKPVDPDLLALWTSRFALLLKSGVTLVTILSILEEEALDPTLATVTHDLREKIEGGEILSQAMSRHPSIFRPIYIRLVRAGEVGGVLEVTMERLNELLAAGVVQRAGRQRLDRRALVDWFWTFGTMLKSGVPILFAMETIADGAPKGLRDATLEMREAVRQGGRMEDSVARRPGLFGPMTTALIGGGEVLLELARWHEQLIPLEAAGKLPRLTAKTVKVSATRRDAAMATSEIIRRVNQMIQESIDLGVERIELRPTDEDKGTAVLFSGGKRLRSVSLDYFASIVRRVKVMGDVSPYGVGQGQIHVNYNSKGYLIPVDADGDGLTLTITPK